MMKVRSAVLGLSLLFSLVAWAASPGETAASVADKAGPPACVPPPSCVPAATVRRLQFPAGALSYGSPDSAFVLQARGLRWHSTAGTATLTLRRPLDYSGGEVEFTLFHAVLDDSSGDVGFIVTPVSFNHGSSFETYGDELTDIFAAPESPSSFLEHTAVLHAGTTGYQWPPSGEWWYFEIRRTGSFNGPLQLMSVAIDY
jgi:hypothetical protein